MVADGLSCPTLNTPRPPSSSICTKIGHLCKFCAHPPHTGWTPTKLYHPKIWRGHSQYKSVPAKRVFGGSHSPNFPGGRDWRNALSPVNMRLLFCGRAASCLISEVRHSEGQCIISHGGNARFVPYVTSSTLSVSPARARCLSRTMVYSRDVLSIRNVPEW